MVDTPQFLPPSIDPAHRQSIYGTVRFIIDKMVKQDMDGMMPVKVVAVNRTTNRVTVEIMVGMINTARQIVKRAQIASVPIYSPSAGGYVINFPVQPGDLGWVKATDTDISLFLQTLASAPAIQPPNTFVTHKFDSAMFFPDNMNRGVTIAGEDADDLVIQKNDSTVRIVIKDDKVKITAPVLEVVASDEITLTAANKVTLDAPLIEITGELTSGTDGGASASFSGSITADGEIKTELAGGINLSTHKHDGVTPGGGDTGEPIP